MGGGGSKDKDKAKAEDLAPVVPSPDAKGTAKTTYSNGGGGAANGTAPAPVASPPAASPPTGASMKAPPVDDEETHGLPRCASVLDLEKFFVFLDVGNAAGERLGKLVFQMRGDAAPAACEHFRRLCTARNSDGDSDEAGASLVGAAFGDVQPGAVARCGDAGAAGGAASSTPKEVLKHCTASLSLAAEAKGDGSFAYGSSFFVVLGGDCGAHGAFDGTGLVVGKCVKGLELFAQMAGGGATVTDAGELSQSTWNFMNPDNDSDSDDDGAFSD